jgi:hypothetical protein
MFFLDLENHYSKQFRCAIIRIPELNTLKLTVSMLRTRFHDQEHRLLLVNLNTSGF